jgi:ABC-type proline/glycine betaine transport system ATPase subunit
MHVVVMGDSGTGKSAAIRRMLAQARGRVLPSRLAALPSNVSDVRMFRVWAAAGLNNITLTPAARPVRR